MLLLWWLFAHPAADFVNICIKLKLPSTRHCCDVKVVIKVLRQEKGYADKR